MCKLYPEIRYCEGYRSNYVQGEFDWLKTHDFNLDFNTPKEFGVVIFQNRQPEDAICSYFDLKVIDGIEDSYDNWIQFAAKESEQWRKLKEKWDKVADKVIWIDEIKKDPMQVVLDVAKIMLLPERSGSILDFREPSEHKSFRYYNEKDFYELGLYGC